MLGDYTAMFTINPAIAQNRATAAWVSFGQKWKRIFCTHYRPIFNQCDAIDLQSYQIWWNNAK